MCIILVLRSFLRDSILFRTPDGLHFGARKGFLQDRTGGGFNREVYLCQLFL